MTESRIIRDSVSGRFYKINYVNKLTIIKLKTRLESIVQTEKNLNGGSPIGYKCNKMYIWTQGNSLEGIAKQIILNNDMETPRKLKTYIVVRIIAYGQHGLALQSFSIRVQLCLSGVKNMIISHLTTLNKNKLKFLPEILYQDLQKLAVESPGKFLIDTIRQEIAKFYPYQMTKLNGSLLMKWLISVYQAGKNEKLFVEIDFFNQPETNSIGYNDIKFIWGRNEYTMPQTAVFTTYASFFPQAADEEEVKRKLNLLDSGHCLYW